MDDELRSLAVKEIGEAVKEHAIRDFLGRSTSLDSFLRNHLGENYPRTSTPRTEVEQAVRAYLGDTGWTPYKRSNRPAVQSLEFGSPIK
jgi:hypothetical protein